MHVPAFRLIEPFFEKLSDGEVQSPCHRMYTEIQRPAFVSKLIVTHGTYTDMKLLPAAIAWGGCAP